MGGVGFGFIGDVFDAIGDFIDDVKDVVNDIVNSVADVFDGIPILGDIVNIGLQIINTPIQMALSLAKLDFKGALSDAEYGLKSIVGSVFGLLYQTLKPIVGDKLAGQISGIVLMAATIVASFYIGYNLAPLVADAVAAQMALFIAGFVAEGSIIFVSWAIAGAITNIAIGIGVGLVSGAVGSVVAEKVPELGLAPFLMTVASSLAYGFGLGTSGSISYVNELSSFIMGGTSNAYLSSLGAVYSVYNNVEGYMSYLDVKRGLEMQYQSIVKALSEAKYQTSDNTFAEATDYANCRYFKSFAGQQMYNAYQPSRELYNPVSVQIPFDASAQIVRTDTTDYEFAFNTMAFPRSISAQSGMGYDWSGFAGNGSYENV